MKSITISYSKIVFTDRTFEITNVIHGIPTWVFPEKINSKQNECPVCHRKMAKEISHGQVVQTCSVIQILANTLPIHTECYDKLAEEEK